MKKSSTQRTRVRERFTFTNFKNMSWKTAFKHQRWMYPQSYFNEQESLVLYYFCSFFCASCLSPLKRRNPRDTIKGKVCQIFKAASEHRKCLIVFTWTRFIESDKKKARVLSCKIIEGENWWSCYGCRDDAFLYILPSPVLLPLPCRNRIKANEEKAAQANICEKNKLQIAFIQRKIFLYTIFRLRF